MCQKKSQQKILDLGLIAPMAPTHAMPLAHLAVPAAARLNIDTYMEYSVSAVLPVPLKPPRFAPFLWS